METMKIIEMIEVIKDKLSESEVIENKGEICTIIPLSKADVVIRSSWDVINKERSHIKSTSVVYSIKVNGIDIRTLFTQSIKGTENEDLFPKLADAVYSNIHATLESYVMNY